MKKVELIIENDILYPAFESGGTFSNPILPITQDAPDGTIWRGHSDGWFYCFYSIQNDNTQHIWRSKNLVDWEDTGRSAFTDSDFKIMVSGTSTPNSSSLGLWLWAPQVIYHDGKYLMYISIKGNNNTKISTGIAVLESERPDGYFKYVGIVTSYGGTDTTTYPSNGIVDSIDPFPVIDFDGSFWLFFGSEGQVHRVRLSDDGKTLYNNASSSDSSLYTKVAGRYVSGISNKEQKWEGTALYYHNGYWYIFGSKGNYNDDSYAVVVGRSKELTGNFVNKKGYSVLTTASGGDTTTGGTTILQYSDTSSGWQGAGHVGEIFTDAFGRYYICFHSHHPYSSKYKNNHGDDYRCMMLQEFIWGGRWLSCV